MDLDLDKAGSGKEVERIEETEGGYDDESEVMLSKGRKTRVDVDLRQSDNELRSAAKAVLVALWTLTTLTGCFCCFLPCTLLGRLSPTLLLLQTTNHESHDFSISLGRSM